MKQYCRAVLFVWCLLPATAFAAAADVADVGASHHWAERLLDVPYAPIDRRAPPQGPILQLVHQDIEELEINRSVIRTPLTIGNKRFERGLGPHSNGHIRITSPEPIVRFMAWIGVDNNERTQATKGSVTFSVSPFGRERSWMTRIGPCRKDARRNSPLSGKSTALSGRPSSQTASFAGWAVCRTRWWSNSPAVFGMDLAFEGPRPRACGTSFLPVEHRNPEFRAHENRGCLILLFFPSGAEKFG